MELNKEFYVYEWIRLDTNEPFYVGKGKNDRCFTLSNRNKIFNNIIKKININNTIVNILHENLSEKEAHEYECWYINEYKYIYGYNLANLTDGGEGCAGRKLTAESLFKMSQTLKNRILTEEWKRKIKDNHADFSGEKHPRYGKHLSDSTKKKISNSLVGINNPFSKKVICITTNEIFESCKQASTKYQISSSGISRACNRHYTYYGKNHMTNEKLVWMFYEDYIAQQNNQAS